MTSVISFLTLAMALIIGLTVGGIVRARIARKKKDK